MFSPPYRAKPWVGRLTLLGFLATLSANAAIIHYTDLNPPGVTNGSRALGVNNHNEVGYVNVSAASHAALWAGATNAFTDLTPAGSSGSQANGLSGTMQVGEVFFAGSTHAALWSGSAVSFIDLTPAGSTNANALGIDGLQEVGLADLGGGPEATVWSGSANSALYLSGPGFVINGISGFNDVGTKMVTNNLGNAVLWMNSSNSLVDLQPGGATSSAGWGVDATFQAGSVAFDPNGATNHAAIWEGSAETFVDLNPIGAESSVAYGVSGPYAAGFATFNNTTHAALWSGSAGSFLDLQAVLGSNYTSSVARAIYYDETNTIYVAGWAVTGGVDHAMLWTIQGEPNLGPARGSLQVNIGPPAVVAAGAEFQINGGPLHRNGDLVPNLPTGSYNVTFVPVTGWLTPPAQTLTVNTNSTTTISVAYVAEPDTAALQVNLGPAFAVTSGAAWQLDAGSNESSGTTLSNLAGGTYLLSFAPLPGWTPPPDQFLTITNGSLTVAEGDYIPSTAPTNGLTLAVQGNGMIVPGEINDPLPGNKYTVRGVAQPRNVFFNWIGGTSLPYKVLATTPSYSFVYQPGLYVQATFVTNIFMQAVGVYSGLFATTNMDRAQTNSGLLSLNVNSVGGVSGSLRIGTQVLGLSGKFSAEGTATLTVRRHNQSALTVSLLLDLSNQGMTGTVSYGAFVAEWTGYQQVFSSRAKAPFAGRYTVIIPGSTNPAIAPYGTSYGTAVISATGTLSFAGSMADGTAVSQVTTVSSNGLWPMYLPLDNGQGSFYSWNYITNGMVTNVGPASWISPGTGRAGADRIGFTNQNGTVSGSVYAPAAKPLLNLSNAVVTLGGLDPSFVLTNSVAVSSPGGITVGAAGDADKLSLSINRGTGVVSGSFLNPENPAQRLRVSGVVVQGQTNAQGYFFGTSQNGLFLLGPP
jgi:hypothetical protein